MRAILTVSFILFSLITFAQNGYTFAYESRKLEIKPSPTSEFTQWFLENNEKFGKVAPLSTRSTTKVTLVFVVDKEGNILEPQIWRGIGQGYDAYALNLIRNNPFKWNPGKNKNNESVDTEVYYQLDFVKNDNKIMSKENYPVRK
jgi:hypothetical protein